MSTSITNGGTARAARDRLLAATPLRERHELLGGIPTAIQEAGEGPPVVLLHGQGEFFAVWLQVIDRLAARHRVVIPDLPGHGETRVPEAQLDADTVLRWVDALLDQTCAQPPVLVGHLLGGAIAARYAVEHASRLAHLALVDTLGLAWYRPSLSFAIPLVRYLARPSDTSRDRLFRQCFSDVEHVANRFGALWADLGAYAVEQERSPAHQAALRTLMARLGARPIGDAALGRIRVPTALIHGRHDLQVPLRAAQRASDQHGWPLYVIEGVRDDPAAEQPESFVDALEDAIGHTARESGRSTS